MIRKQQEGVIISDPTKVSSFGFSFGFSSWIAQSEILFLVWALMFSNNQNAPLITGFFLTENSSKNRGSSPTSESSAGCSYIWHNALSKTNTEQTINHHLKVARPQGYLHTSILCLPWKAFNNTVTLQTCLQQLIFIYWPPFGATGRGSLSDTRQDTAVTVLKSIFIYLRRKSRPSRELQGLTRQV